MAGLGDMFGASFATVNGQKPRNSDRIQEGQPLNLRGAFEAAQNIPVAGDVLSGVMAAYDAAKGDYPSAAMNAVGMLPFVSGTFIGKGAKTWDAIKAADAEKRIAAGDDVRKVWKETGTFKGPDGHFRQEIPDNKAKIHSGNVTDPDRFMDIFHEAQVRNNMKLGEALFHPEAYKAYPSAKTTGFKVSGESPTISGNFDGGLDRISITDPYAAKHGAGSSADSVTMHELQHAIQQREGWARGGSAEEFLHPLRQQRQEADNQLSLINEQLKTAKGDEYLSLLDKRSELIPILQTDSIDLMEQAHNKYRSLAGEAEARATQSRMNMNMEQRLNTYPLDSYDVPVDQLIIRGNTPIGAAFGGK
jgi:hypothetical protein